MPERMIIVTVPFGCHVLLPESQIGLAMKFEFVERETYPKHETRMYRDQVIEVTTIKEDEIVPAPPTLMVEPVATAAPTIVEEVQASNELTSVDTGDIPF